MLICVVSRVRGGGLVVVLYSGMVLISTIVERKNDATRASGCNH